MGIAAGSVAFTVDGVLTIARLLHSALFLYLHPRLGAVLRRPTEVPRSATAYHLGTDTGTFRRILGLSLGVDCIYAL